MLICFQGFGLGGVCVCVHGWVGEKRGGSASPQMINVFRTENANNLYWNWGACTIESLSQIGQKREEERKKERERERHGGKERIQEKSQDRGHTYTHKHTARERLRDERKAIYIYIYI